MPKCLALTGRAGLAQVNQDLWGLGWTNVHVQGWRLFHDTKLNLSFLGSSAWSSSKACVVTEVAYKAGRVTDSYSCCSSLRQSEHPEEKM